MAGILGGMALGDTFLFTQRHKNSAHCLAPVGAGLLAKAAYQATLMVNVRPYSRASPLPHWLGVMRPYVSDRPCSAGPGRTAPRLSPTQSTDWAIHSSPASPARAP
ncbi:hypothetical protein FE275_26490 [Pseudomonas koreensis]|nr:hypothetical protein FE275_26490 [Pseudomonas koreensis]